MRLYLGSFAYAEIREVVALICQADLGDDLAASKKSGRCDCVPCCCLGSKIASSASPHLPALPAIYVLFSRSSFPLREVAWHLEGYRSIGHGSSPSAAHGCSL